MDTFHCVIKKISVLGIDAEAEYTQNKKFLSIKLNRKITDTMPICFKIEVD